MWERRSRCVASEGGGQGQNQALEITLRHTVKAFSLSPAVIVGHSRVGSCNADISAGRFFAPHCLALILWKPSENISV